MSTAMSESATLEAESSVEVVLADPFVQALDGAMRSAARAALREGGRPAGVFGGKERGALSELGRVAALGDMRGWVVAQENNLLVRYGDAPAEMLRHKVLSEGASLLGGVTKAIAECRAIVTQTADQAGGLTGRTDTEAIWDLQQETLQDLFVAYRRDVLRVVKSLSVDGPWADLTEEELGALYYPETPGEVALRRAFDDTHRLLHERVRHVVFLEPRRAWPIGEDPMAPGRQVTLYDLCVALNREGYEHGRHEPLEVTWELCRGLDSSKGNLIQRNGSAGRLAWAMRETMRIAREPATLEALERYVREEERRMAARMRELKPGKFERMMSEETARADEERLQVVLRALYQQATPSHEPTPSLESSPKGRGR